MKYQPGMIVKLSPLFTGADTSNSPVWGGKEGHIGGTVRVVKTHYHDAAHHTAQVEWFNKQIGEFTENQLINLSGEEELFSQEMIKNKGCLPKDIFILLRTGSGRFILNAVESMMAFTGSPIDVGRHRYTTIITNHALPEISPSDYVMVSRMLSFPHLDQVKTTSLYGAEQAWFAAWKIQAPRDIYHPLPTFKTITEVVAKLDSDALRGAYAMFHLTNNLCDYSVSDAA